MGGAPVPDFLKTDASFGSNTVNNLSYHGAWCEKNKETELCLFELDCVRVAPLISVSREFRMIPRQKLGKQGMIGKYRCVMKTE